MTKTSQNKIKVDTQYVTILLGLYLIYVITIKIIHKFYRLVSEELVIILLLIPADRVRFNFFQQLGKFKAGGIGLVFINTKMQNTRVTRLFFNIL
jgi:hypothetical protein